MVYRTSAIALFAITIGALFWNAWLRESSHGDAVVGDAFAAIYFSIAVLVGALFVIMFQQYRPQDRYWGYATLGAIIGFWLQR